jgi:hypothetical protein
MQVMDTLMKPLPPEVECHARKLLYLPFSKEIKPPQITVETKNKILNYLAEDVKKLKQLTGLHLSEWDLL